jgi:hypothetical protein
MFYIYAYFFPDTDIPFYVGKGTGTRMYDHLNEASSKKENKEKWEIISSLISKGTPPDIKIIEDNIESELMAFNREDYFILKWGRKGIDPNGILTNKTLGGKQPPKPVWTDEKKKQHSEWNKFYWTAERRALHRPAVGTISVTDKLGNSKRIPKSLYESIDKTGPINTWEYVSVSSKESKRRKQQNITLGPVFVTVV